VAAGQGSESDHIDEAAVEDGGQSGVLPLPHGKRKRGAIF
jgi:hypothetical protein